MNSGDSKLVAQEAIRCYTVYRRAGITDILNVNSYEIVSQSTELKAAVLGMEVSTAISLDTESNSRHRYPEQLCLIQIATDRKVHIIDTISLRELTPLKQVLAASAV